MDKKIFVPIRKGEGPYHLYEIKFTTSTLYKTWRIQGNSDYPNIDYSEIRTILSNLQKGYFSTRMYSKDLTRGSFNIIPQNNAPKIEKLTKDTVSITLGLFLAAFKEIYSRQLKDTWDAIVVTGDLGFEDVLDSNLKVKAVTEIDGKKEAFDTLRAKRKLFLCIPEEKVDEETGDNYEIKVFTPDFHHAVLNQIINFIFKPVSRKIDVIEYKNKIQKTLLKKFEADCHKLTSEYLETDEYLEIREEISVTGGNYYLYGEGKRGKSACAAELARYLVRTKKIFAPIWITIENNRITKNYNSSRKYLLSELYDYLRSLKLCADPPDIKNEQDEVNTVLSKNVYLIVLDNLELPEVVLDTFLQAVNAVFEGTKAYLLITSRTNFPRSDKISDSHFKSKNVPKFSLYDAKHFFISMNEGNDYARKIVEAEKDVCNNFFKMLYNWFGIFPGLIIETGSLFRYNSMEEVVGIFQENKFLDDKKLRAITINIYKGVFDNLSDDAKRLLLFLLKFTCNMEETLGGLNSALKNHPVKFNSKLEDILHELDYSLFVYKLDNNNRYKIKPVAYFVLLHEFSFSGDRIKLLSYLAGDSGRPPFFGADAEGIVVLSYLARVPPDFPPIFQVYDPQKYFLLQRAVLSDWRKLKSVPEELKTAELCLDAVDLNGDALQYVPEELKTAELCLDAVRGSGSGNALRYVPEELKTAELCLVALRWSGDALRYVPEELKTAELCFVAVHCGNALRYVPEELKTAELCLGALRCGNALRYVPEKLKTAELCLDAVLRNGNALRYVPEELKTAELCLDAVLRNGNALRYVPEELKTAELCLVAVHRNGDTLRYVPEELKTTKFYLDAVHRNGDALRYVPEELKTAELCLVAVHRNGNALRYVPEELKTTKFYLDAVHRNGDTLRYVPAKFITEALCRTAIQKNPRIIKYVPEQFKNEKICYTAFYHDLIHHHSPMCPGEEVHPWEFIFQYFPKTIKTFEFYLKAYFDALDMQDIPLLCEIVMESQNYELCLALVLSNPRVLPMIPEHLQTPAICLTAVKNFNGDPYYIYPRRENVIKRIKNLKFTTLSNNISFLYKYPKICLAAVKTKSNWAKFLILKFIPEELKTPKFCLEAVLTHGLALKYVPKKIANKDLYLCAVLENGLALKYIPSKFRTKELCLTAVKNQPASLKYVPKQYKSKELYLAAAKNAPWNYKYIPKQYRNNAVLDSNKIQYSDWDTAVRVDGLLLRYVPYHLRTPELCLASIKCNGKAFAFVPGKIKTKEFCLSVVQ
ncbi:hypothetical protein AGMMS50230_08240 [Spirochaetia bacterium]|nr:hypothetical protein AGMMS50230_08240 [Spirochaetia bacterium]